MDWKEIEEIVAEAAESGDPILSRVKSLRLDINHISMLLWDPYAESYDSDEEVAEDDDANKPGKTEMHYLHSVKFLFNFVLFSFGRFGPGHVCPRKRSKIPRKKESCRIERT